MQTDKCPLTPEDLTGFRDSFITKELAEKAATFRVSSSEGQALVGNSYLDCSGIVYPFRAPNGQTVAYAVRRDNPETDENGKPKRKYLYEKGFRNNLYYATNITEADTQNVDLPLAFSEGPKKCLALERMQTEGKKTSVHYRWLASTILKPQVIKPQTRRGAGSTKKTSLRICRILNFLTAINPDSFISSLIPTVVEKLTPLFFLPALNLLNC